jgi:hypothetical protein
MHRCFRRNGLCAAVVAATLFVVPLPALPQAQPIALVLDIEGTWYIGESTEKLDRWDALPAGAEIKAAAGDAKRAKIVILYQNNTTQTCGYSETCLVKSSLAAASLGSRIADALSRLFPVGELLERNPDRYVLLGSRGTDLRDGVVPINGTTVDLASVFRGSEPGDYVVQLKALSPSDSPALEPVSLRWRAGQPLLVKVPGTTPGLYELRLLVRRYGQLEETSRQSWVLLAGPERFPAISELFAQGLKATEAWGPDVDPEVVRSFLRAYLEHLATSESR